MNCLRRVSRLLPVAFLGVLVLGVDTPRAVAAGGGHGGGAGHLAAFHGGPGWNGVHAYRGWGYPYYGYGLGFGVGLGLGYGLGYGYGYPYYGCGYGYGYPYYGYPDPGYAYPPYAAGTASQPPAYAPPAPAPSAAAPPPAGPTVLAARMRTLTPPPSEDNGVSLIVRVPAEAEVWVNGRKTNQSGARREFVSSGLAPGQSYTFMVRAQWPGPDGKLVVSDQRISVRAGERRALDFGTPVPPAAEVVPAVPVEANR